MKMPIPVFSPSLPNEYKRQIPVAYIAVWNKLVCCPRAANPADVSFQTTSAAFANARNTRKLWAPFLLTSHGLNKILDYEFLSILINTQKSNDEPIPVAARICVHSLVGILGSKPTRGKDVSLLWVFYVSRLSSLGRAVHSPRWVLPTVLCPVRVIAKPRKGRPWPGIGSKRHTGEENQTRILSLAITKDLLAKFLSFFLFILVWTFLPTHCRCRVLLLHLITLNDSARTHTHTHTHTLGLLWTKFHLLHSTR